MRTELFKKIRKKQQGRSKIHQEGRRDQPPNLLDISNALDDYYFLEKLILYCSYLSYRLIVAPQLVPYHKSDFRLIRSILHQVNQGEDWHPAIHLYAKLCHLFDKAQTLTEQEAFEVLDAIEQLIDEHRSLFSTGELVELYSYLSNFAVYQMNSGKDQFLIRNIRYNLEMIQLEKSRKSKAVINVGVYKNLIVLMLKAERIADRQQLLPFFEDKFDSVADWANHFAEEHQQYLPQPQGEKYYKYTKALILFHRGQYELALPIVEDLPRPRVFFLSLDLKILHLQLLIELLMKGNEELDEEMEVIIEQLRDMLKQDRNKRPKLNYQRKYYEVFYQLCKKFLPFYRAFAWMDNSSDQEYKRRRRKLESEAQRYHYSYCNWFLQKIHSI